MTTILLSLIDILCVIAAAIALAGMMLALAITVSVNEAAQKEDGELIDKGIQ